MQDQDALPATHSSMKTWIHLLVSIFFTIAYALTAAAAPGDQCRALFANTDAVADAVRQQRWERYYRDKVGPYYKRAWDHEFNRYYRHDFLDHKRLGSREIAMLEKLGFEVTSEKINAPDLPTFVANYLAVLDSERIPESKRILPALTFRRQSSPSEIILRVPGKEPWTEKANDWAFETLRLDDRLLAENIADGRFPLFTEGAHDVFHFVTFALYPEYAAALRAGNQKLIKMPMSLSQLVRSTYALEVLTLADPARLHEMIPHFALKSPGKDTRLEEFLEAAGQLTGKELIDHANFWAANFQRFLKHYGSGMAEPYERNVYRNNLKRADWLSHFYEGRVDYVNVVLPNELLNEGMTHMDTLLQELIALINMPPEALNLRFRGRAPDGPKELDRLLRLHVARMEYALWKSATQLNPRQWIHDTVVDQVDPNSPTMKFIRDSFGKNSITYRKFMRE